MCEYGTGVLVCVSMVQMSVCLCKVQVKKPEDVKCLVLSLSTLFSSDGRLTDSGAKILLSPPTSKALALQEQTTRPDFSLGEVLGIGIQQTLLSMKSTPQLTLDLTFQSVSNKFVIYCPA
ncbi:hypothetical protein LEMLEM_LOCUS26018 [Lemmus lemmus]